MEKQSNETYDEFYSRGGWKYHYRYEYEFLRNRILQPLGIKSKGKVLELGCGTGLHSDVFRNSGFQVTAVDQSSEAIQRARESYSGVEFRCEDATKFLTNVMASSYDIVFARGLSWFHYELNHKNRFGFNVADATETIMRVVRPQGYFVLQIQTDFSGLDDFKSGIRNHTWDDLLTFMGRYGTVVLFTDWNGVALLDDASARHSGRNAIIIIRRQPT